jgi:hypothetical protein
MFGKVWVREGATLRIEEGTTIRGDKATEATLVVQPGGKIFAQGTKDRPIVFTSQAPAGQRRAGDWGGVIILGKSHVNQAGGSANIEGIAEGGRYGGGANPVLDDNSGVFSYVRIEYSGAVIGANNEINGLTLGGVGSGTKIDHVQVRHTLDDCFEFFGGTVNAKYLACQWNQDDGLDMDLGYTGKVQFFLLQQDPGLDDETNGFEVDNENDGRGVTPFTEATVYNATMCGKNKDLAKPAYGVLQRRNAKGHYFNVLAQGFDVGLDVRNTTTADHARSGAFELKSSIFSSMVGEPSANHNQGIAWLEPVAAAGGVAPNLDNDGQFDEAQWWLTPGFKNAVVANAVTSCFDADNPAFHGTATEITANAATPPNDGFFDASATYIGAVKDANDNWWKEGIWAVWRSN